MEHKITDRQLVALLASYTGQPAHWVPSGVYGEAHDKAGQPYWHPARVAGGSIHRMLEDLRCRDYLTTYNRHDELADKSANQLTAKGYAALAERLDRLPTIKDNVGGVKYRFQIDVPELQQRWTARREQEAERARLRADRDERQREERANRIAANRVAKLVHLRALFRKSGLAVQWDDDQLLTFADSVASI